MTLFGLVYRVLPQWSNGQTPPLKLAQTHFLLSVTGVLGVFANGIMGYRILDIVSPEFYYLPEKQILNLWLSIDGVFLSIFGIGCVLFLVVLLRSTSYAPASSQP